MMAQANIGKHNTSPRHSVTSSNELPPSTTSNFYEQKNEMYNERFLKSEKFIPLKDVKAYE